MKKIKIIFASRGSAAKTIACYIAKKLQVNDDDVFNVSAHELNSNDIIFEHLILVCPTYGMENFLIKSDWSKHIGLTFSAVEMGLYRGYDSPLLGAAKIIQLFLNKQGLMQSTNTLSLDSVPSVDFSILEKWLTNNFRNHEK